MESLRAKVGRKTGEIVDQVIEGIDIPAALEYAASSLEELPAIFEVYRQELADALQALVDNPPTKEELFSIPNSISTAGFLLVANGCRTINTWAGVAQIAAGRSFDLIDGAVARTTGQTSAVGAVVDAALDKAGMLLILSSAWHQNAMPKEAIVGMVGQNGLSASTTARHKLRDPEANLRPTKTGKAGMFLQNAATLSYLVDNAMEREGHLSHAQRSLHFGGNVLAVTGVGVGLVASWQYAHRLPPVPRIDI